VEAGIQSSRNTGFIQPLTKPVRQHQLNRALRGIARQAEASGRTRRWMRSPLEPEAEPGHIGVKSIAHAFCC